MGRAPCCEKDSVKRGPWTPEEDAKLLACIGQYGTGSWRTLPKKAGLQRCGKSCRLRWTNYLRPDLKHGRFSDQEEQLIVKLHAALGSRWSLIAAQLPGRTDNDVKNYWNTRLKKKLCEMGIDPITHKPISQLLADLAGSMTLPKGTEIAEATLGCFKDDMLNVLMRTKRSDSNYVNNINNDNINNNVNMLCTNLTQESLDHNLISTKHTHNLTSSNPNPNHTFTHMSFAPLAPPSLAIEEHKPSSHHPVPLLLVEAAGKKPGRPCGPVSGIRSAASLARNTAVLNHVANPSSITKMDEEGPLNDHNTSFSAAYLPLHYDSPSGGQFGYCTNDADQSHYHVMQDILQIADHRSITYEIKEIEDHSSFMVSDQFAIDKSAADDEAANDDEENCHNLKKRAEHSLMLSSINAGHHQQQQQHHQQKLQQQQQQQHVYTALLTQQEMNNKNAMTITDDDEALLQQRRSIMLGAGLYDDQDQDPISKSNIESLNMAAAANSAMQWSPVSYNGANSGSSSSNLSLAATRALPHHHHQVTSLDLTSEGLLWDLSELVS